jgi:hypothetical protein
MNSSRRDIVDPIAIVRTSLVSNPVAQPSAGRSGEFAGVFADAMKSPRSGRRKGYGYADLEPGSGGQQEAEALRPPPSLLQYNSSIDLYVRLDTLLREKSLLIAIV